MTTDSKCIVNKKVNPVDDKIPVDNSKKYQSKIYSWIVFMLVLFIL